MSTARTRVTVAGAGLAVALLIAGCSSGSPHSSSSSMSGMSMPSATSGAPTRSDFNAADVSFLQMMYPHHAQAVEMAKLVPPRSQNQELITLAASIEQAQAPQLKQMADLLHSFGKPAPQATVDHAMPGIMSADQMTKLQNSTGTAFDRMWLQMMIDHHQGALDMANTEVAQGANADAKAMAHDIITGQQAEITQMQGMLTHD